MFSAASTKTPADWRRRPPAPSSTGGRHGRRREVGQGTADRYEQVLEDFREFIGPAVLAGPLANITPAHVSRYRDALAGRFATSTANLYLTILRGAFAEAAREGVIAADPAARVRPLKAARDAAGERRALSAREIRAIIEATDPADEWRGIILAGIYTGQRLGDIATMRRQDVSRGWWRFTARKTGAAMAIPLAKPFVAWLQKRKLAGGTCVFPEAAARVAAAHGKTGTLSNQFHAILARAGLVEARTHAGTGKGRAARRAAGAVSFHYLRHTTNTMLKAAGAPESVAMAILGHSSKAVSQVYTHLPESALAAAVKGLRLE
jgi:integrase